MTPEQFSELAKLVAERLLTVRIRHFDDVVFVNLCGDARTMFPSIAADLVPSIVEKLTSAWYTYHYKG